MSLKKLLNNQFFLKKPYSNKLTYDELINAEAEIGKTVFGPIPNGRNREFFVYKNNVWIWHESWFDESGLPKEIVVRYEVRPAGVYKKVSSGVYKRIEGEELNNFVKATKSYFNLVKTKLYS